MDSERDRDPQWDMSFLKRHWLYAVGLVALLCVVIGAFVAWRANQPVETKRVYALPEPNPERAEILKRALSPHNTAGTESLSARNPPDTRSSHEEAIRATKSPSRLTGIISTDLEQKQSELDKWAAKFYAQYPNLAYPQALVDNYQRLLDLVTARYEQLQNLGFSEETCKNRLVSFVEILIPPLLKENKELYISLMRESIPASVEVNRYLHQNDLRPLPNYLLGKFKEIR